MVMNMSDEHISAANDGLTEALASGWHVSEWEWEVTQEQAAVLAMSGDTAESTRLWNVALKLAQENFSLDDLRLGTSLANIGFCLARAGQHSETYLHSAIDIWNLSPLLIDHVAIKPRGRSSSHHLRMAVKNRGIYEARAKRLLQDSAAKARIIVSGQISVNAREQLEQWRHKKPLEFSKERKILSACFLLVSI